MYGRFGKSSSSVLINGLDTAIQRVKDSLSNALWILSVRAYISLIIRTNASKFLE